MTQPLHIRSHDNPLLVQLRRVVQDGAVYRKTGKCWLEGEHLCAAAVVRGIRADRAVLTEAAWHRTTLRALADTAAQTVIVPAALMKGLSTLESAAPIGFVLAVAADATLQPTATTVVLDRLQDAGNVGSILRSAAALGVTQVLALKGTVALWSPKVLRAGMGAHFALGLIEGLDPTALDDLTLPMLATSSHAGAELHNTAVPHPAAWIFGHEGQGVSAALTQRCALTVRIPQPGGEESLNVAAAAAICLYESLRQSVQSIR